MPTRVSVYIDYQNAHMSAHETWCGYDAPVEDCLVHPFKLAELIVERRLDEGDLHEVHVYRGRPDPRKQATLTSANDKAAQHWLDAGCQVHRRPLRYPHDWGKPECYERPREKGVDVALAVDMVRAAINREYDVGILVSRDTDLLPAVETIRGLDGGPEIEVATWEGNSRLRLPSDELRCHRLTEEDFMAVRDGRFYGPNPPYKGPRMKF